MPNVVLTNRVRYAADQPSDLLLFNMAREMDDVEVVCYEDLAIGIKGDSPFIIMPDGRYLTPGSEELPRWVISHGAETRVTQCLELMGVSCFSGSEMTMLAKDKVVSSMLMSKVFFSPDALFYRGNIDIESLPDGKRTFMLKSVNGHEGDGVWKIDRPETVATYDRRYGSTTSDFLFLQQLMPSADDVRVYVIGDEIVGAVTRKVPKGVWKSNLTSNPVQEEYELSDQQKVTIEKGIKLLPKNRGFITLDFLFGEHGELVFCEMNTGPGYVALQNLGREEEVVNKYFAYAQRMSEKHDLERN